MLEVDFRNFFVSVGGEVKEDGKYFEKFVEWSNKQDFPNMDKKQSIAEVLRMVLGYIER